MKVTYYGHACFGVEFAGHHLLFDPFISPNPLAAAQAIDLESIPADFILISHGHEDHIADVISIAQRTGAQLISTYEIITWFGKQGVKNGHPMNHGGQWTFPFGTVKVVNAVHSSGLPDGSYGGNPAGFVISGEKMTFYYSGDTALSYDMKLIGDQYPLDLAFLCMGDNFTMGPQDALTASNFVNCDRIIGMHYDTFGYIEIDHTSTHQLFSSAGKTLHLMDIGSELSI